MEIEQSQTDREIQEMMKGVQVSSEPLNRSNSRKCKKKSSQSELKSLKVEYHNLLLQWESIADDNQHLAERLEEAHKQIIILKNKKPTNLEEESTNSCIPSLQREEIRQAKEYIKELETVVEKSKNNIIFLKDLVLSKDEKYKNLLKEVSFYKELSETHIAESSRLAKEIISIRSKYNKILSKSSPIQVSLPSNYQLTRTQSAVNITNNPNSLVNFYFYGLGPGSGEDKFENDEKSEEFRKF